MDKPTLELLDLEKLVKKLNSSIKESEGEIYLGTFIDRIPRRASFLDRVEKGGIERRGRYPLIQAVEGEGLFSFMDLEAIYKIGSIFIETGYAIESYLPTKYERVALRLKTPLELKNNDRMPNCGIKLTRYYNELLHTSRRIDICYVGGLILVGVDLSDILPTEWFLK